MKHGNYGHRHYRPSLAASARHHSRMLFAGRGVADSRRELPGSAFPLGGLFLIPLLVAATCLSRSLIFAASIATAIGREYFERVPWEPNGPTRLGLSLVAFTGGSLFAGELIRNRRLSAVVVEPPKTRDALAPRSRAGGAGTGGEHSGGGDHARFRRQDRDGEPSGPANPAPSADLPEGDSIEKYVTMFATLLKSKQVMQLMRTMVEARGPSARRRGILPERLCVGLCQRLRTAACRHLPGCDRAGARPGGSGASSTADQFTDHRRGGLSRIAQPGC